MEREKLSEYVRSSRYREAMGLPAEPIEEYRLLAQGEYNANYLFRHPVDGKQYLLRVNHGSQMHLPHQIEYEYHALKLLHGSGRTPQVFYVDDSREILKQGVLVMEFLPGRSLDYRRDLEAAAEILADIHSLPLEGNGGLLSPEHSLRAILEECEEMVALYFDSPLGDMERKRKIRTLLDEGWRRIEQAGEGAYRCIVNTELNSTNFLINGEGEQNYLIDWEKPIYGDPAQDLGHFLAKTTSFWKTDILLEPEEKLRFLHHYMDRADGYLPLEGLRERTELFEAITCLRGISWCAMAWVEYRQPDKALFNESTFRKLESYLSPEFLAGIKL